jgi:hypothetical protein
MIFPMSAMHGGLPFFSGGSINRLSQTREGKMHSDLTHPLQPKLYSIRAIAREKLTVAWRDAKSIRG